MSFVECIYNGIFWDELENFSEVRVFNPKSRWQPPKDHPCLEVF